MRNLNIIWYCQANWIGLPSCNWYKLTLEGTLPKTPIWAKIQENLHNLHWHAYGEIKITFANIVPTPSPAPNRLIGSLFPVSTQCGRSILQYDLPYHGLLSTLTLEKKSFYYIICIAMCLFIKEFPFRNKAVNYDPPIATSGNKRNPICFIRLGIDLILPPSAQASPPSPPSLRPYVTFFQAGRSTFQKVVAWGRSLDLTLAEVIGALISRYFRSSTVYGGHSARAPVSRRYDGILLKCSMAYSNQHWFWTNQVSLIHTCSIGLMCEGLKVRDYIADMVNTKLISNCLIASLLRYS